MLLQLNVTILLCACEEIYLSACTAAHCEYLSQHITNNIFVHFTATPLQSCGLLTSISALNSSPITRSHLLMYMYICGSSRQHCQFVLSYIIRHDVWL